MTEKPNGDATRGRKQFATAGPRSLYPEIATSESLAQCGLLAQLLFTRLIAQADDQGRLRGSPRSLRGQCLPMLADVDVEDVEQAREELASAGAIQVYQADGQELVQIPGWWRWQTMRRAYPSRFPPPAGWTDRVFGRWGDETDGGDETGESGPPPGDDSGNLREPAADSGSLPSSAATRVRGRAQAPPGPAQPSPVQSGPRRPPRAGAREGHPSSSTNGAPRTAAARKTDVERKTDIAINRGLLEHSTDPRIRRGAVLGLEQDDPNDESAWRALLDPAPTAAPSRKRGPTRPARQPRQRRTKRAAPGDRPRVMTEAELGAQYDVALERQAADPSPANARELDRLARLTRRPEGPAQ